MTLKDLVELACEKDLHFKVKVQWYRQRKKPRPTIDLEWLMPQLEQVLGRDFVREAAEEEINAAVDQQLEKADGGQTEQIQA